MALDVHTKKKPEYFFFYFLCCWSAAVGRSGQACAGSSEWWMCFPGHHREVSVGVSLDRLSLFVRPDCSGSGQSRGCLSPSYHPLGSPWVFSWRSPSVGAESSVIIWQDVAHRLFRIESFCVWEAMKYGATAPYETARLHPLAPETHRCINDGLELLPNPPAFIFVHPHVHIFFIWSIQNRKNGNNAIVFYGGLHVWLSKSFQKHITYEHCYTQLGAVSLVSSSRNKATFSNTGCIKAEVGNIFFADTGQ